MFPGSTLSGGKLNVLLGGTPVAWNAGYGYTSSQQLCVVNSGGTVFINGILCTATGQVQVQASSPQMFVNGIGLRSTGELCMNAVGSVTQFNGGIPQIADGSVAST